MKNGLAGKLWFIGNFQALSYFGVAKYIRTFYITIYGLKKNNKSFVGTFWSRSDYLQAILTNNLFVFHNPVSL